MALEQPIIMPPTFFVMITHISNSAKLTYESINFHASDTWLIDCSEDYTTILFVYHILIELFEKKGLSGARLLSDEQLFNN